MMSSTAISDKTTRLCIQETSERSALQSLKGEYSFLLVEDHPMFAEGFSGAIKKIFPAARLQIVSCGHAALSLFEKTTFDLVFLDLNLPDISGFDLLAKVQKKYLAQPVVILTGSVAPLVLDTAKRLGAMGAFSKRVDNNHLKKNCLMLLEGEPVFEADSLLLSMVNGEAQKPTSRELDVLMHLAEGLDNADICIQLCISDSTIRTHLRNLFFKLDVSNRTACVMKAARLGWI
jgi:DNA-binding NarL/FixJ family response regulator